MRRILLPGALSIIYLLSISGPHGPSLARAAEGRGGVEAPGDSLSGRGTPDTLARLTVAESGVRLGAGDLHEPIGLAADSRGFVYVADAMAGKVFRYSPSGESLEFERPPENASFYPIDVAAQEPFIFVLDYSGNVLRRYDYRGAYLDVLVSFGEFEELRPVSVSTTSGGRILVTDIAHHAVASLTPLLDVDLTIGEFGRGEGRFNEPRKAVLLPDQRIAVVESGNRRVQIFSPSGAFERTCALPDGRKFVSPRAIAADVAGNLFIADPAGGRIAVFSSAGAYLADIDSFAGQAISPSAIAIDWGNRLLVADLKSRSILVYRLRYPSGK